MARTMTSCSHCGLPVPPGRADSYCCFGCRVMHGVVRPAREDGEGGPVPLLRVQLFAGLFMALNVMALSFAFYGPGVFGEDAIPSGTWGSVSELFEYLILFFTTVVVATLGLPMFVDALREGAGRFGWVNARTLVCAGVFAAFTLSAWHTLRGLDPIYYDTVTMVLVILTIGKHLAARAKVRTALELEDAAEGRALWWKLRRDPLVWRWPSSALSYDVAIEPNGQWVVISNLGRQTPDGLDRDQWLAIFGLYLAAVNRFIQTPRVQKLVLKVMQRDEVVRGHQLRPDARFEFHKVVKAGHQSCLQKFGRASFGIPIHEYGVACQLNGCLHPLGRDMGKLFIVQQEG